MSDVTGRIFFEAAPMSEWLARQPGPRSFFWGRESAHGHLGLLLCPAECGFARLRGELESPSEACESYGMQGLDHLAARVLRGNFGHAERCCNLPLSPRTSPPRRDWEGCNVHAATVLAPCPDKLQPNLKPCFRGGFRSIVNYFG